MTGVTSDDLIQFLSSRQSIKAVELNEPAPDDTALERLLSAAVTAPDHGAIRPWRFLAIRGEARNRLADIFEKALRARDPDVAADEIAALRGKPLRSPLIVAVVAEITENHPKVPPEEQVIATACAAQNLLLAAHADGWGAILLTGWTAHDPMVRKALGFAEKDQLIGYVYMGTPGEQQRTKKRPDPTRYLSEWIGPEN
ncbi:nitroreductase [Marivibrio halodurans]|uniref:Putative NAD(P)H nitroreductase n=1 Tax=Marivibrio halodurans TaxID=2039722 RepID=A0A8J7V2Y5_9PROT|nr:nitroreductase [Marivibrio halodurans]MBP5857367.1 nitroreductase [Marivibrio halodurans]